MSGKRSIFITDAALVPLFAAVLATGVRQHVAGETQSHDVWHVWAVWHTLAGIAFLALVFLHLRHHWGWYKGWRKRSVRRNGVTWLLSLSFAVTVLTGALLLWALFALWAIVPMLVTHRVVHLDEAAGTLTLRKGLRTTDRADLSQVDHAVGEAERGSIALIGLRARPRHGEPEDRQWVVQEIGWDARSFDGLRVLQAAAGLRPAPPRGVLVR